MPVTRYPLVANAVVAEKVDKPSIHSEILTKEFVIALMLHEIINQRSHVLFEHIIIVSAIAYDDLLYKISEAALASF